MATRVRYQIHRHPLLERQDIIELPYDLQRDYYELIEPILKTNPYTGGNLFNTHLLKGRLKGYYALEVEYNAIAYRVVYRIYEKPAPKRVNVISIGEHDPAYERAIMRLNQ